MKMFIPQMGSGLILNEDWTFPIYRDLEYINMRFLDEAFGSTHPYNFFSLNGDNSEYRKIVDITIPKGTEISIKKLHYKIVKPNRNYMKFRVIKKKDVKFSGLEFCVMLSDLTDMDFELKGYNEETYNFVINFLKKYEEKYTVTSNTYRDIERVLLESRTPMTYAPQKGISSVYKSIMNRIVKTYIPKENDEIEKDFKVYYRRYTIEKILE